MDSKWITIVSLSLLVLKIILAFTPFGALFFIVPVAFIIFIVGIYKMGRENVKPSIVTIFVFAFIILLIVASLTEMGPIFGAGG